MSWLSWSEVQRVTKSRRVVLYGYSFDWIDKTLAYISADAIVDNAPSLQNTFYKGIKVVSEDYIFSADEKPFIIIINSDYRNLSIHLSEKEFVPGGDFCFCPEFINFKKLEDLREHKFSGIFTSPDYKVGKVNRTSRLGGGIFSFEFDGIKLKLKKIKDGQYRQIVLFKDEYFVVEHNKGEIHIFSRKFELLRIIDLGSANFCGLSVNENGIWCANTMTDQILNLTHSGEICEVIQFGNGEGRSVGSHHINDIEIDENNLYVSYFSKTGFWRKGIFDGGLSAFSLDGQYIGDGYKNLWQPHSPKIINGNISILDSSNSILYNRNNFPNANFQGFIRGLFHENGLFYIGQSETLYLSQKVGLSNNIASCAGLHIFEEESKTSRFFSFYGVSNIHDIIINKENF